MKSHASCYIVVFTARRVCIARTMPWQDVCPSVCPSHAGIMCKRLHISSKFLHHRVVPILVFPYQMGWQYSDGDHQRWRRMQGGYEKITIFDQYLALSRNWCKIESHSQWRSQDFISGRAQCLII